jgi:hypothetical protein
VVYLVAFLGMVVVSNAIGWLDGHVPVGTFDPFFSAPAFFLVLGYGGIHLLDALALRGWASFRPMTSLGEEEAARVGYELTTMHIRPTLICVVLGIATAATYIAFSYGRPFDLATGPITVIAGLLTSCVVFAGTWTLLYHSLHQLRIIGRVHHFVESIDLLDLDRLHAFATVTAANGVALLALGYVGLFVTPDSLANPQVTAWAALTTAAAVACFVVPLYGIHGLIAAEKSRRLTAVGRLLGQALGDLHDRTEQRSLADAGAINDEITSLVAERELLTNVSTWPWSPDTLRGFATAIVLPIVLWLVYRLLGEQLA